MPQVPVYNTAQAEPAALPNPGDSLAQTVRFGTIGAREQEAMGAALIKTGSEFGQIAAEQQATENEAAVKQQAAALMEAQSKILRDPSTGYLFKPGADAVKAFKGDDTTPGVGQTIADLPKQMAQNLTNPRQQQMWQDVSARMTEQALNEVRNHAGQQLKVYNAQASQDMADTFAANAALAYPTWNTEGSAFQTGLATAKANWAEVAKLKFGSAATQNVIDSYVQSQLTKLHKSVVDNMIADQKPQMALDYINSIKSKQLPSGTPELQPEMRAHLQELAQKTDITSSALAKADQIYGLRSGDEKGAMEDVAKIADPQIRLKAETLLKERYNTAQVIEDRARRAADNAGLLQITNGGSLSALMKSKVWNDMSAHGQETAQQWVRTKALQAQQLSMGDKMSDMAAFQSVLQIRQENPAQFASMNIVKTAANLGIKSPQVVHQLLEMQTNVNKNDAKEKTISAAWSFASKIYTPMLEAAKVGPTSGMKPGPAKERAIQEKSLFESNVQTDIVNWMTQNGGRVPDDKAVRQIITNNLTPVQIGGTGIWNDDTKRLGVLTDEERAKAYVPVESIQKDAPGQYQKLFNDMSRQLGRAPTVKEIEQRYAELSRIRRKQ
jgi:hypothetical protein